MTSSTLATDTTAAKGIKVTNDALIVELRDGRSVSVPLTWYPRLAEGRPAERRNWELIGPGTGIHWPDLDEDISIEGYCSADHRVRARRRCSGGERLDDARLTNEWSRRALDRESARLIRRR
jgi:hypothetical protein